MSFKAKYRLYYVISLILLFTPILIVIGINFKDYFYQYDGWKIALGFIIGLLCFIGLIKGKADFLKGTWGFGIVFLLAILFKPIINDIILLSGSAFLGKLMSNIIDYKVKRYKRLSEAKETADINATAMKEVAIELEIEKKELNSADWRV